MRTDARIDEPLKVLIVEDEVLLAIDLESHLEALGQEIVGLAGDATQALALADVEHPDLALVDINLRDGRTGLVISSELGAGDDTTVVLVT
ncbi:MAG: response regulator, partial [Rhizobiales bacterium]|nr:response regulator [Hyphomicrobiales bacterium]